MELAGAPALTHWEENPTSGFKAEHWFGDSPLGSPDKYSTMSQNQQLCPHHSNPMGRAGTERKSAKFSQFCELNDN